MIVIQDTHEQMPWSFEFYPEIEVVKKSLKTGDYTLQGMEDILTIDRKRNVGEISHNLGVEKTRFEKELTRMMDIKYSHIMCEFSIANVLEFPVNSGIPKNLWKNIKIGGKYLLKTLYEYQDKYGVTIHFCGNRDAAIARAVEVFYFTKKMVEG